MYQLLLSFNLQITFKQIKEKENTWGKAEPYSGTTAQTTHVLVFIYAQAYQIGFLVFAVLLIPLLPPPPLSEMQSSWCTH